MLKKLKIKFVLINLCLVGVVLMVVFSVVCYNTYRQAQQEVDRALDMALGDTLEDRAIPLEIGGDPAKGAPGPKGKQGLEARPLEYAAVIAFATQGEDGTWDVSLIDSQGVSMGQEKLEEAAVAALEAQEDRGKLGDLQLFYGKSSTATGDKLAFVDASYFNQVVGRSITTAAVLFVAGMVMLLLISLLLSRIALAPLQKAWKQQQQFVADASHELKTPLTVILANNDIIRSHETQSVESQKKWLESTQEEVIHMKNLVEDLLYLARSDEDPEKRILVKTQLDLSHLVTDISLQFEPVVFEKGASLDLDIGDGISMTGDETRLKQLVHILLDNATKYTGDDGKISLSLQPKGGKIRLEVTNTGDPILPEDLEHIFERFYRSDKARTREGGYGLGLSIAKTIVEQHGGKITAENTALPDGQTAVQMTVVF